MHEKLFSTRFCYERVSGAEWALLTLVLFIGAFLRFWGLGNIGLHGDEETMALAVVGILETGSPVLPSEMYYPRALPQLYLMAVSAAVFGVSEWALRLPSAVAGSLTIGLSFWLSRRFVSTKWAVFVAFMVAIFPFMIALSQTARMYIFLVLFVMLFCCILFRWERTGSFNDLVLSFFVLCAAISIHSLAVFSALLFLFPGLLNYSKRVLIIGAGACASAVLGYTFMSGWINSQYVELVAPEPAADLAHPGSIVGAVDSYAAVGVFLAVGTLLFWQIFKSLRRRTQCSFSILGFILIGTSIIASAVSQFHIAFVTFASGTLLYLRYGGSKILASTLGACIVIFGVASIWLIDGFVSIDQTKNAVMTIIGLPSPWPYVRFSTFFPLAVASYCAILVKYSLDFIRGQSLPDHVLFLLLAVWAPLFAIGIFVGHIPVRYVSSLVPFFILCFVAGATGVISRKEFHNSTGTGLQAVFPVILILFLINPIDFWRNVNVSYADFPYLTGHRGVDHKGAAEYILSRELGEKDVVMVADALQQVFYLGGRVDYYIRSLNSGRNSTIRRNNRLLNLYTGTPQITTGEGLADVVNSESKGTVYVVGSGELESNRMFYFDHGIWATMETMGFQVAYEGRDGATFIWKYDRDNRQNSDRQ